MYGYYREKLHANHGFWDLKRQVHVAPLFEGLITTSTGQISIRWIPQSVLLTLVRRIAIYPLDSVICPMNNWVLIV